MGLIPTFRDFLTNENLKAQHLTIEQTNAIWSVYDQLVWARVQEMRNSPDLPVSLGVLNQILAEEMIADHLGAEWVDRNILDPSSSDQAKKYLALGNHRLLTALSLHRVQQLARRLYQLQSFSWFDTVLNCVRTRELSGAAFELDVLWTLQIASLHVETRRESGVKGSDYDSFALMGERLVPVEVKAKDDTTPLVREQRDQHGQRRSKAATKG